MPPKDNPRAWVDGDERAVELVGPVKEAPSKDVLRRFLDRIERARRVLPRIAAGVTVLVGTVIIIGDIVLEHQRRCRARKRRLSAKPKRENGGAPRSRMGK